MAKSSQIKKLLRRDREITVIALLALIAISWAYVLAGAGTGVPAWHMNSLKMALGQGDGSAMEMAA